MERTKTDSFPRLLRVLNPDEDMPEIHSQRTIVATPSSIFVYVSTRGGHSKTYPEEKRNLPHCLFRGYRRYLRVAMTTNCCTRAPRRLTGPCKLNVTHDTAVKIHKVTTSLRHWLASVRELFTTRNFETKPPPSPSPHPPPHPTLKKEAVAWAANIHHTRYSYLVSETADHHGASGRAVRC
ncbi:hypothetical protein C0Q70_14763 [Pomacea canaliculata]|uniref:Uncharacterized protein n=1 Tax=Pomacea canaliculata TaxID=400727 RepID=A0A2T7NT14_POMCA|nr:hypothetical protein C0Q70_14763 [Pomacea canaliculata]